MPMPPRGITGAGELRQSPKTCYTETRGSGKAPMSAVDYGREALDFIEGLGAYDRVPDAMDALETAFVRFGFETIIVTGLPNPDQRFAQMVLAKRWPTGWFSLYTQNNYDRVDPVVRLCRQSLNPFE